MIFITVGSQKFQFDRLLKSVDDLVERGIITEDVFAQTGYSTYIPQHYPAKAFLDRDEFAQKEALADIVITHGGTGAIIGAVKKRKKLLQYQDWQGSANMWMTINCRLFLNLKK